MDDQKISNQPQRPSFTEAFLFWLKLGFISFGGPAGQIAIMHSFLVEKKKWISDSRFLHALNYCMVLPGPEAQQLATYMGWLLHGTRGGLVAGIFFILPSIFILLALSTVYVMYGKLLWVASIFYALKPAIIVIIILAMIKIGKKSLLSNFHYAVAILSFCCIFFFSIPFPFPIIIVAAVALGFVIQHVWPSLLTVKSSIEKFELNEHTFYINAFSSPNKSGLNIKSVLLKIAVGVGLWFLPIGLFYFLSTDFIFWKQLISFFTKAAFVTFGGAYAVLPYVAQESVERFQWLNQLEMIDGLALGETTPGPLIMVLVFVGFMAGYHQMGSLVGGALGLFATAYYTFLPCFLFILIGAPWVEQTKQNTTVKSVLAIVTAAVVGVIFNLLIYLGKAVIFPTGVLSHIDWVACSWLLISAIALYRFKVNMILWIGISALVGLLYSFIQ